MRPESASAPPAPRRDAAGRRAAVLRAVVEEYVRSGHPVASSAVACLSGLRVSSATVPSDMAALEGDGLIMQPHASPGRVPSPSGYRRFVDQLRGPAVLGLREQRTIFHQFHQVEGASREWMALAVLSRMVHAAAVVTAPRRRVVRIRAVQVVPLDASRWQVVVVDDASHIAQREVAPPSGFRPDSLRRDSDRLTKLVSGLSAREIDALCHDRSAWVTQLLRAVAAVARDLEQELVAPQRFAGVSELLAHPEFEQAGRVREVVALLEDGSFLRHVLNASMGDVRGGVRVFIGGEGPLASATHLSAVLALYDNGACGRGLVGVLGPSRLPYRRAVATVATVSAALSRLVAA